MAEQGAPIINEVSFRLSPDASFSLFDIRTGSTTQTFGIEQNQVAYLIGMLRDLGKVWEDKRRELDPVAGKPGDVMSMTAIKPKNVKVAKMMNSDAWCMIFETKYGPQTFLLGEPDLVQLAHVMLAEVANPPKDPTKN